MPPSSTCLSSLFALVLAQLCSAVWLLLASLAIGSAATQSPNADTLFTTTPQLRDRGLSRPLKNTITKNSSKPTHPQSVVPSSSLSQYATLVPICYNPTVKSTKLNTRVMNGQVKHARMASCCRSSRCDHVPRCRHCHSFLHQPALIAAASTLPGHMAKRAEKTKFDRYPHVGRPGYHSKKFISDFMEDADNPSLAIRDTDFLEHLSLGCLSTSYDARGSKVPAILWDWQDDNSSDLGREQRKNRQTSLRATWSPDVVRRHVAAQAQPL